MKHKTAGLVSALVLSAAISGCATVIPGTAIDSDKAEAEIAKAIKEQIGTEVTLTCPDEVALKPGEEMTCTVADLDGGSGTVKVSLKDADGNLIWKLEDGDTLAKAN